jgi:hypothetical protein
LPRTSSLFRPFYLSTERIITSRMDVNICLFVAQMKSATKNILQPPILCVVRNLYTTAHHCIYDRHFFYNVFPEICARDCGESASVFLCYLVRFFWFYFHLCVFFQLCVFDHAIYATKLKASRDSPPPPPKIRRCLAVFRMPFCQIRSNPPPLIHTHTHSIIIAVVCEWLRWKCLCLLWHLVCFFYFCVFFLQLCVCPRHLRNLWKKKKESTWWLGYKKGGRKKRRGDSMGR